jgi:hypothetical protein
MAPLLRDCHVLVGALPLLLIGACGPSAGQPKASPVPGTATAAASALVPAPPRATETKRPLSQQAAAPRTGTDAVPEDRSIVVAAGQAGPTKIALTDSAIYWIDEGNGDEGSGSIMKVAKAGGPITALATHQVTPLGLAVDGASVFWTSRGPSGSLTDVRAVGSVLSVALAGGSIRTLASHRPCPDAIALGAADVFFTERGLTDGKSASVSKVAKMGGQVSLVHGEVRNPGGLVVDGSRIYWSSGGSCESVNGAPSDTNGAIYSADLRAGAPKTLASGLRCPEGITLDDAAIYFTSMEDGAILRLDKNGGVARVVAQDAKGARYVAVDAATIYWANQVTGAIRRQAKAGGAPETLAVSKDPAGLAVDETFVYFTDSSAGVVMKRPK